MSDGRFDSWGVVVVVLVGSLLFTCSLALSLHLVVFVLPSPQTHSTAQHSSVKSVIGKERKGKGSCYTSPLPLPHFPHFISNSLFLFLLLFSTLLYSTILLFCFIPFFSLNQNPTQTVMPLNFLLLLFFLFLSHQPFSSASEPRNPEGTTCLFIIIHKRFIN